MECRSLGRLLELGFLYNSRNDSPAAIIPTLIEDHFTD
jgi:hypothetical protein